MNKTPYQILGVSPTADDEEIKQAYRELARKYHPDRYSNSDLSELASEKMKEINAAYEEIREMRASGNDPYAAASRGASGGTSGNSSGSAYGGSGYQRDGYTTGSYREGQYSQDALRRFALIRNCLNQGNLTEAERLLNETPDADRGAEWYFLLGHIQLRKGFHVDAQNSFETAYRMEPTNNEYWTFKEKMRARAQSFGGGYQTGNDGGCSSCDMCSSLICADCCCECMGGDLIPCC